MKNWKKIEIPNLIVDTNEYGLLTVTNIWLNDKENKIILDGSTTDYGIVVIELEGAENLITEFLDSVHKHLNENSGDLADKITALINKEIKF